MYSVSPRVNIFSRGHGGRQQPRSLSAFFCSTKGFVLMSVVVLILWTISLYMFLVVYSMSANVGDPELDPPAILATKNRPSGNPEEAASLNNENSNATQIQASTKPQGTGGDNDINEARRKAVKRAYQHTFQGYKKYAWGYDELKPVSRSYASDWGRMAATMVDSMDTMLVMGLDAEFNDAMDWVEKSLKLDNDWDASTFETTIRYLGGLLAAYELSGKEILLTKAKALADRLIPAFNTKTGIPYATVNLKTGKAWSPGWSSGSSFLAEFGTLSLEWTKLGYLVKDKLYYDVVDKVTQTMLAVNTDLWEGLFPSQYHPDRGQFTSQHITFGARGDSFYEYLLKQWILTGKTDKKLKETYDKAMGMKKRLIQHSTPNKLTYIAEQNGDLIHKMDHLACFLPGLLTLDDTPDHLDLAKELMYTCYQMYARNPTGIAPEIAGFDASQVQQKGKEDFFNQAPHYLLRPETVESLMYLYRATKNPKYREWGWEIFEALERFCKTDAGFSGIRDVGSDSPVKDDKMESFFLAETLKYFYLLFSPIEYMSLDRYVFTTEAHPLKIIPELRF